MKNPLKLSLAALIGASAFAFAQTTAVTTGVETYSGNVVSVSPQSSTMVLSSQANAAPVTYSYTKETQFVDPAGNVVSYDRISNNTPVRVEYVTDGDVRRVSRVVVQSAPTAVVAPAAATTTEATTTTTTTSKKDDDD